VKTTFFYAIKDLKHIYNIDADLLRWKHDECLSKDLIFSKQEISQTESADVTL
jgi:hypothetical protein